MSTQGLTAQQVNALEQLLLGWSYRQVAAQIGVTHKTVWRWMRSPVFRAQFEAEKRQVVTETTTLLTRLGTRAVTTLGQMVADPAMPPAVRVTAARTILELVYHRADAEELTALRHLYEGLVNGEPAPALLVTQNGHGDCDESL